MSFISRSSSGQEKSAAAGLGARRTPRSGAGEVKGDLEFLATLREWWMIECKETHGTNITFEEKWWDKLSLESVSELKTPALTLRAARTELYVLLLSDLDELFVRAGVSLASFTITRVKSKFKSFTFSTGDWFRMRQDAMLTQTQPCVVFKLAAGRDYAMLDSQELTRIMRTVYGTKT